MTNFKLEFVSHSPSTVWRVRGDSGYRKSVLTAFTQLIDSTGGFRSKPTGQFGPDLTPQLVARKTWAWRLSIRTAENLAWVDFYSRKDAGGHKRSPTRAPQQSKLPTIQRPGTDPFLAGIDKSGMHPMRLASMLAATYLVAHWVPAGAAWLRSRWMAPFVLMGQQSLPVFCAGIFLSFLGRVALESSDRWPMQLAVNLFGLIALVALAALTAWYAEGKRAPRPPPVDGGLDRR